jgi:gluconate 5-dehydrogenase
MNTGEYLNTLFSLDGKQIMITGAAGGIGSAIARAYAHAGARLALCGRTLSKCESLVEEIQKFGGSATAYFVDVADRSSIHNCVEKIIDDFGRIDVLCNVAGINKREGLLDVDEETYDRIMDTNLKGVFFTCQEVARNMYKHRNGNIINIGSHNDEGMLGGCSVYGASKSGVVALTRSLAVELAQYGIRANAISPGHILTELTQVTWDHPTRAPYLRERIAMKRPGRPDELAGIAVMLASDASSYMSGQAYHVDGGCLCGGTPWEYDTNYPA